MNAVIYARYSSHSQTEQSVEGQLRDGYQWAAQQGVSVIGEYVDRALTGTKDQRPDFQRMIADAAKKQFEIVIVWKLDRFARNRYDSAIYKAKLKKYGVRVVSVKENITDTPEGIILEGLLESMAEYYSANLSQNIRRGQRESVMKGKFLGGTVPYGYRSANGKLVADEKQAYYVRYIYEQYAMGIPKKQIIDDLNAKGVRNKYGAALTYSAFSHILTNTAYIGQYKYNGEIVPDLSEPIITEELFEKVQARLKLTARAPAAKKARVPYLLQGKVFCGICGSPMIGESGRGKSGTVFRYYNCAAKKKDHSCKKKNEKKDFIEWYVVEQTMEYILSPSRISRVAQAVVNEYKKEFSSSRVAELDAVVKRIDHELDKLVDALIDAPKAAHQKIYARMDQLEAQKADTEADLARLRVASEIVLTEAEVRSWLKSLCTGDPMNMEFRQRIIDTFINSIYLYDDRIVIFYNIRGGKQVSFTDLSSFTDSSFTDPSSSADVHSSPPGCSDFSANAPPIAIKSEPKYVFINGIFGCIFPRDTDDDCQKRQVK